MSFTDRAGLAQLKDYSLTSFQEFGLAEPIARALAEEKYVTPTPIQVQTIPIDVDGINHVLNFDLPNMPETYVHRIGREPERKASPSPCATRSCVTSRN